MPTGFRTNLNILKRPFNITILVMLLLFCFSFLSAADYDFDKLSTLARQKYGEEAYKDILDLQQLVTNLKTAP